MARIQYFDFQQPDSTVSLNNRLRGVLKSGVYLGYIAKAGTTGLEISIDMVTDPDNAGQKLGKIFTRDAVVIEEDADLVDEATGFVGDGSDPRKDALVATYIYNASLPNNQVVYEVIQGVAAASPVLPTLTDDQLLLAEIDVPTGSTLSSQFAFTRANLVFPFTDDDKNIQLLSTANLAWTLLTTTLTWSADIKIDIPYLNGFNTILSSASPAIFPNDGDLLVVTLDRTASVNVTPSIVAAADADTLAGKDSYIVARRFGNSIVFSDGTNISDGEVTALGSTELDVAYISATLEHWFAKDDTFSESAIEVADSDTPAGADVNNAAYTGSTGVLNFRAARFVGTGLDDMTTDDVASTITTNRHYIVEIDGTGSPDTFKWSNDGGATQQATTVPITAGSIVLEGGISITFAATTGHTTADKWEFMTVDLSSVLPGDSITDPRGKRFWIQSVIDNKDTVQLLKGLDLSLPKITILELYAATLTDEHQIWQVEDTPLTFVDKTLEFAVSILNTEVFPATEAVNDYHAIGFKETFYKVVFDDILGTQGVGGVVAWEYWNGTIWSALTIITDDTVGFTSALSASKVVEFAVPTDWARQVLNGSTNLYYIRARVTTVYTTNPIYNLGFIVPSGVYRIQRSNIVFENTGLVGYTFLPTVTSGGIITYASSVDLRHVRDGQMFQDSSGKQFPISSVDTANDSITLSNVTALPDVSAPTSIADGSIFLNNNPRSLNLFDMKPVFGYEVITFTDIMRFKADPETRADTLVGSDAYAPISVSDKRIRFYGNAQSQHLQASSNKGEGVFLKPLITGAKCQIEVTAWMTGLALLVKSTPTELSTGNNGFLISVDGHTVTQADEQVQMTAAGHTGYSSAWWTSHSMRNLTPGVHTIRLDMSASNLDIALVVGVVILNQSDLSGNYAELPGILYSDSKKFTHTLVKNTSLPALSARGGKLIRYAPASAPTTRAWAHTALTVFSQTGNTNTGSPTIASISNVSGFKVGDIVRIVYASLDPELRRVTVVGVNSIQVVPNPSNTEVGVSVQFRGATIHRASDVSNQGNHGLNHPNEQISFVVVPQVVGTYKKVMGQDDFFGNLDTALGRGQPLSDSYHHMSGDDLIPNLDQTSTVREPQISLNTATGQLRFSFVGTGLDVYFGEGDLTNPLWNSAVVQDLGSVVIDGMDGGNITAALAIEVAIGGAPNGSKFLKIPLCQDLDYGHHTVEIIADGAGGDVATYGFVVYEPKKTSFVGFPIWESNYIGDHFDDISDINEPETATNFFAVPSGLLRSAPEQLLSGTEASGVNISIFPDIGPGADFDSTFPLGRSIRYDNLHQTEISFHYIAFYGDLLMLDMVGVSSAASVTLEFLDYDNVFRSPSSFLGETISEPTGGSTFTVAITPFERRIWTLAKEGLHIVRLSLTSAANGNLDILAIGTSRILHMNQRKPMRLGRAFLQPTPAGRDVRQVKGYELPHFLPPVTIAETAIPLSSVSDALVLRLYSTGGWASVSYSAEVAFNGTQAITESVTLKIRPDNGMEFPGGTGSTADDIMHVSDTVVVYLSEGYHYISVTPSNTGIITSFDASITVVPMPDLNNQSRVRRITEDLIPMYTNDDNVR